MVSVPCTAIVQVSYQWLGIVEVLAVKPTQGDLPASMACWLLDLFF